MVLSVFVTAAVAGLFGMVIAGVPGTAAGTALADWHRLATVAILGALGAALSATLTAIQDRGRIPELFRQDWVAIIRPLIGAASAMVVVIVLETGITGILVVSGSSAFPFAIGAGFSERLLARVMNAVESAAEK